MGTLTQLLLENKRLLICYVGLRQISKVCKHQIKPGFLFFFKVCIDFSLLA